MKRLSLLLTACALSPLAHGQAYGTICSETFEYPTGGLGSADGGIGWNAPWYSGANLDDALVTTPGLDGVGEKCTTQFSNAGSFRMPQTGPHPDLAPNFNFGSGDGVMWITFTAGRVAGTTDDYGGLSLITQFGGEHLFIGAPYQTYEWGIVDVVSGNVVTVPGSNIDQTTTLVVRIGFAQGGDTVDLWVDPIDAHPTTPADASFSVADFEWNEVRLQSGENQGGSTGFDFDGILFEKELPLIGVNYCSAPVNSTGASAAIEAIGSDIASANSVTLRAASMPGNQFGIFIVAPSQGFVPGLGGTSNGNLCLSGSIGRYVGPGQILATGTDGSFQLDLDLAAIPQGGGTVATSPGQTWNFQGWYRDGVGLGSNLTDGVSIVFQ
ncbi:MAG: hypothetical protein VXW31_01860 [Planctomycetota bacterium]|nr:hypothetical protein [Planctomycetota bacterium]